MNTTTLGRRTAIAATCGVLLLAATACGSDSSSTSTSSSESASASGPPSGAAPAAATEQSAEVKALIAQVQDKFQHATYEDSDTGESLPYNVYLPDDYDAARSYPLVLYIADSSFVGQDVTAPLSQYGALIWASEAEQAKHESIVVVPEYPEIIIDDHDSYTTTDYVEMTARLVEAVRKEYTVDADRVYGTGQSMGCMTVMYLAAQHPELFAATYLVSGQWDIGELEGLAEEKFVYLAAAGDPKASAGQTEVEGMLDDQGVAYSTATWDATWSEAKQAREAATLFSTGTSANFATFAEGTVLPDGESTGMGGEHMASFEPAYKVEAARDWLFEQHA